MNNSQIKMLNKYTFIFCILFYLFLLLSSNLFFSNNSNLSYLAKDVFIIISIFVPLIFILYLCIRNNILFSNQVLVSSPILTHQLIDSYEDYPPI